MFRFVLVALLIIVALPAAAQDGIPAGCIYIREWVDLVDVHSRRLWNLATGELTALENPTITPEAVISPDDSAAAYFWMNKSDEGSLTMSDVALYIEEIATGKQTLVQDHLDINGALRVYNMLWSYNSVRLAVVGGDGTEYTLLTVNRDGTNLRMTPLGVGFLNVSELRWSSDSHYIAVGNTVLNADTHEISDVFVPPMPFLTPPPLLRFETPRIGSYENLTVQSISPDGQTAIFQYETEDEAGIVVYSPDDELPQEIAIRDAFQPKWSPDGTRLAFLRWEGGYHTVAMVLDVQRFEFTHIATVNQSLEWNGWIAWMPCSET
jgi:hypothetical protein